MKLKSVQYMCLVMFDHGTMSFVLDIFAAVSGNSNTFLHTRQSKIHIELLGKAFALALAFASAFASALAFAFAFLLGLIVGLALALPR